MSTLLQCMVGGVAIGVALWLPIAAYRAATRVRSWLRHRHDDTSPTDDLPVGVPEDDDLMAVADAVAEPDVVPRLTGDQRLSDSMQDVLVDAYPWREPVEVYGRREGRRLR